MPEPIIINFGHVLSKEAVRFLQEKIGKFTYVHERLRVDFDRPLNQQVQEVMDTVEKRLEADGKYLEESVVYIVTPGLTDPSLLLLVEILGRSGQLPKLLPMRKQHGIYVIYDILDLERIKLLARGRRKVQVLSCQGKSSIT